LRRLELSVRQVPGIVLHVGLSQERPLAIRGTVTQTQTHMY